jgi:hypothetical protein
MRTQRTTKTTATRSAIETFKAAAAEPKPQEPSAQLLYSIAFTNKFLPARMWSKMCADGTVRLIGTVARTNNITHQGNPVNNDQLAGLTVEVRVTPDQFEIITDGAEDMVGGGVSILFEVGEPSLSELTTANGEEVNSIVFYAKSLLGIEVNQTAIGSLGFETKEKMDDWFLAARSQNNNRQKRRQEERTSRLQAARAAADAANNNNNTEWAAPATSANPME